jgi:flagellar hook-associated protein 2
VIAAKVLGKTESGTYNITVTQRARNGAISFDDRFTSLNSVINSGINNSTPSADRTLTVQVGTGSAQETVNLEVSSTTTASELVEMFNSNSNSAQATLINVGTSNSPSYALQFASKESGTEKGTINISVGTALSGAGSFTSNSLSQATDARFNLSGVSGSITRSSNTIGDLISGITFDIEGVGSSTLVVSDDIEASTSKVKEFVESYNKVIKLIDENDLITQESNGKELTNVFGSLSSTSLDETIRDTLRQTLSGLNFTDNDNSGNKTILADIGITTSRDGTLEFNEDNFKKYATNNTSKLGKLLEKLGDTLGGTQGKIAQFTQYQGLIDKLLQSNDRTIKDSEKRISEIEDSLLQEQDRLRAQFAKLEASIGAMNSKQATLTSLLK